MIRRLKKDVLPQLPPKQRKIVSIVLDNKKCKEITSIYERLKNEAKRVHYEKIENIQPREAFQNYKKLFIQLYSESAVVKIQAVFEYIKDLLESEGEKFLILPSPKYDSEYLRTFRVCSEKM